MSDGAATIFSMFPELERFTLVGTKDPNQIDGVPVMADFDTPGMKFPGATIVQWMFEFSADALLSVIPPALHPTIPPTVTFRVCEFPESPIGPFKLAQTRVECRSF